MMKSNRDMFWRDVNTVKPFTENTPTNKSMKAKETPSVLFAGIQWFKNFIEGIKELSVYDAASILISEANWIQKNTFNEFRDKTGKEIKLKIGKVYYIDYGKAFSGELAYFHYGLCIGKRENKVLVVPMTSGTGYFSTCYHPTNNPSGNKKHRQALMTEGFSKDCVLKIDDCKYISAGRIEKETLDIDPNVVKEIQKQVFQVEFRTIYQQYDNNIKRIEKLEKQVSEQKEIISKLKEENLQYKNVDNQHNNTV